MRVEYDKASSPTSGLRSSVDGRTFWLIFAAALAIRAIALIDGMDNPSFLAPINDSGAYDEVSTQLAESGEAPPRLFWQPVLYPLLLALLHLLSDGSILFAKSVQVLLGALTCSLVYVFGAWRLGSRAGLVAAGITTFYGPLVLFEGELLAAGLAAFMSMALLLCFELAERRPSYETALLAAFVSSLAILARPTFLPMVALTWLWLIGGRNAESRARWAGACSIAIGVASVCVLLPIASWNAAVTGDYTFVPTSGGLNVYLGNNENVCETAAIRPGLEWNALVALPDQHGYTGFSGQSRYFRGLVEEYALSDPLGYLTGLGRKSLQLIGSREIPRTLDLYMWREWSTTIALLVWKIGPFGFPFGVLLPLAVVGLVFRWKDLGFPLLLLIAAYGASIVLVFVTSRYRVPMIPALAVAAAAGVQALGSIARSRDRKIGALAAALIVGTLLLATIPGPFCEEQVNMKADFYSCLALSQHRRSQPEDALASYLVALEADPDSWRTHYDLGVMYGSAGELERARHHYLEAIRVDDSWPQAHSNLAGVMERGGAFDEAVVLYRRALQADERFHLARRNLARLLLDLGRPSEALATLEELQLLDPSSPWDHVQLGRARLALGDSEGAVSEIRRGISKGANDPRSHYELGMALLVEGNAGAALEEFSRVVAEVPDFQQAHYGLGVALAMLERPIDAEAAFRQAVSIQPDFIDARIGVAESLRLQGDDVGAARELREVLSEHPGHPVATDRLSTLELE